MIEKFTNALPDAELFLSVKNKDQTTLFYQIFTVKNKIVMTI